MSVDNRRQSPIKKNAEGYERHDSSSIAEESHLIQGSASRASSAQHKKYGSAIEESINESVPSGSGHNSESSSMIIPKKVPIIPQKS